MARIISGRLREALGQALAAGWDRLLKAVQPERLLTAPAMAAPSAAREAVAQLAYNTTPRATLPFLQSAAQVRASIAPRGRVHPAGTGPAWADLMARISHDLRTPLNAVIGFSDVMNAELLGPVGNPRYREYAGDIRICGQQLLKATEDTLAMTALLAGPSLREGLRPIGLAVVAGEAWDFCAAASHARTLSLELICDGDLEILAELRPMRQVLVNLFSEAIGRSPDGGCVRLTASPDGDTVQIEVEVANGLAPRDIAGTSLPISVARTLLEMQGSGLLEIGAQGPDWRAITIVDRANQRDFFPATQTTSWQPQPALC